MQTHELWRIIRQATSDPVKLERLKDVFDLLTDDLRLVKHSHDTFLPAARDYLRGRDSADYHLKKARVRRSRLGGASRWLYYHQKKTFEKAVRLLSPFGLPKGWTDRAWAIIKNAESKALTHARRDYKG